MGRRSIRDQLTVNLTYRVESLKTLLDPEYDGPVGRRRQIFQNRRALLLGESGSRSRPRRKKKIQKRRRKRSEERADNQSEDVEEETEDTSEESDTDDEELPPWEREKRMKARDGSTDFDPSEHVPPSMTEAARRQ